MKITPITAALIGGLVGSAITYSLTNSLGDSGMSKRTRVANEEGLIALTPCLGSEFGKTIAIEGTIVDDTDTLSKAQLGEKQIEVDRVDGVKLTNPVVVELSLFSFTDIEIPIHGTRVRLRGYETGGFSGIPVEAFNDIPRVATSKFHFHCRFQITKLLDLKEAEQAADGNPH